MPAIIILFILAFFIGIISGCVKGCNNSFKERTQARIEEREQIRRHEEEDRQRAADMIRQVKEEKQRRIDELSSRDRLLTDAVEANSQNRSRDSQMRAFALREVPSAWNTLLSLRGEINSVNTDLAAYRKRLSARGVQPDGDAQYVRLKTVRNAMVRKLHDLEAKLDAAYLESLRAEIAPGGSVLSEETRSSLVEAQSGVDEVVSRYHEIGGSK